MPVNTSLSSVGVTVKNMKCICKMYMQDEKHEMYMQDDDCEKHEMYMQDVLCNSQKSQILYIYYILAVQA